MKKRILSGMRPTGKLHLGHLVGALKNWSQLQSTYDCFFMVADWHALMSEYKNPKDLKENIIDNVCDWISCGIEPDKSVIFVQSQVKEHLELNMILSCITPLGWLERCPTYKEQIRELKDKDISNYAFLGYPVLQAADILVYKASSVPVGLDQLPHLELTREIARRFNFLYGKDIFPEPEAILTEIPKLFGLDGRKMSKSYANTINLSDGPDIIRKKVSTMFTDTKRIKRDDPGNPDVCNAYSYYIAFEADKVKNIFNLCKKAQIGCVGCKQELADILIQILEPIQKKRNKLLKDKTYIKNVLRDGSRLAGALAEHTLQEVKKILNFYDK